MFENSLDSVAKKKEVTANMVGHEMRRPDTCLNDVLIRDPEEPIPYMSDKPHPASFDLDRVVANPKQQIDAQIVECDRQGRYRLKSYDKFGLKERMAHAPVIYSEPTAKLELMEAIQMRYGNLREESFPSTGNSYDSAEPFSNFTPLFMGPYYRNQFMYKMLELKSKCYEAFNNNPVGHRIPNLITQFTLGKGVTAVCKSEKTKKVWDAFASLNKIGTSMNVGLTRAGSRLRMWSNQLSVDGEMIWQFVPTKKGLLVKYVDSATVLDIVTDPEDIDKVFYAHVQYSTPMTQYIQDGKTQGMRYIIRDIPGPELLHIKINTYENEKRGRSDLASIIGWLKRLKDLVNANVIKAYFQACQTYDYEINGSPQAVAAIANAYKNLIPTPGSGYFHNTNIKRTLNPPIGATGAGSDNDMMGLMNLIAMGSGINTAYLMGSMSINRAGVLAETEPSAKFFFERQSIWDETLHAMFDRLAKWHCQQTGEVLDDNIEFSFPQVTAVERGAYITTLGTMVDRKWFREERAAELCAKEFSVTNYNFKEERKAIEQEAKDNMQRELELNKVKSAAQTHLSLWQSILADSGAKQTQETLGPDALMNQPQSPEEDPANPANPLHPENPANKPQPTKGGKPSGNKPKPKAKSSATRPAGKKSPAQSSRHVSAAKPAPTKQLANTGGISDKERSDTSKRVGGAGAGHG